MKVCQAFFILMAFGASAAGFEKGDTLVATDDVAVKDDYRTMDTIYAGTVVMVKAVERDRLQVEDGKPGWVESSKFVLREKATSSSLRRRDCARPQECSRVSRPSRDLQE